MEIKTYVYANFEYDYNMEPNNVWEWLLNKLPDVSILDRDYEGFIEFKAPKETVRFLEYFIEEDYETIFQGTLDEFYEQMGID